MIKFNNKKLVEEAKKIMPDLDAIIDLYDFSVIYMSEKNSHILGYAPEELIGKPMTDFLAPSGTDIRGILNEQMLKKEGERIMTTKTIKGRDITLKVRFYTLEYEEGFYQLFKIL